MGYRRDNDPTRERAFRAWLAERRPALEAIGLPLRVYEDAARWDDFLRNGELHWHEDATRFDFTQLAPWQLARLRALLEAEYGTMDEPPALLRWMRLR